MFSVSRGNKGLRVEFAVSRRNIGVSGKKAKVAFKKPSKAGMLQGDGQSGADDSRQMIAGYDY
jgi:hypothetical protein